MFHALLSQKYEGMGRFLGQEKILFLAEATSTFTPIVGTLVKTLSVTLDAEIFELQIAAAAGQKEAVIEMEIPRHPNSIENNLFTDLSYIGNEIEQKMNAYYIGIPCDQIVMTVSPDTHTQIIRTITPANISSDKVLDWIQSNHITPSKVAGLVLIRHIFLGTEVPRTVTNDFAVNYNFKGIKAIINHRSACWIQMVFNNINGTINPDIGNYRMIQRAIFGKGLVYGDLMKLIKEPSSKNKPLPFEEIIVKYRDVYNSDKYGFKDWGIEIPNTVEELQNNYRKLEGKNSGLSDGKVRISSQGPAHTGSGYDKVDVLFEQPSGDNKQYEYRDGIDVVLGNATYFKIEEPLSLIPNKGLETYQFEPRNLTFNKVIRDGKDIIYSNEEADLHPEIKYQRGRYFIRSFAIISFYDGEFVWDIGYEFLKGGEYAEYRWWKTLPYLEGKELNQGLTWFFINEVTQLYCYVVVDMENPDAKLPNNSLTFRLPYQLELIWSRTNKKLELWITPGTSIALWPFDPAEVSPFKANGRFFC